MPGELARVITMNDETRTRHECKRPLIDVDDYGEWLRGCITRNIWWTSDNTKKAVVRSGSPGTPFAARSLDCGPQQREAAVGHLVAKRVALDDVRRRLFDEDSVVMAEA